MLRHLATWCCQFKGCWTARNIHRSMPVPLLWGIQQLPHLHSIYHQLSIPRVYPVSPHLQVTLKLVSYTWAQHKHDGQCYDAVVIQYSIENKMSFHFSMSQHFGGEKSYHIWGFQFLPSRKVSYVDAIVVNTFHAAFEILATAGTWLTRERYAPKGYLGKQNKM